MTQLSDNVPHVLRSQYANDENLAKRLNLHASYSTNQQPWQRWVYEQLSLRDGERINALRQVLGQAMEREGVFQVDKDAGALLAFKTA
jgi:hypothetical protein